MIPRINPPTDNPYDPIGTAVGGSVIPQETLPEDTVVAHGPGPEDKQARRTAVRWAEHLCEPFVDSPLAAGPGKGRRAVFHLDVRLHPDDRDLSRAEWAKVAHCLAYTVGIDTPRDENGCPWVAVQGLPARLDLIATLIRRDGTWQQQPAHLAQRLTAQARRIEQDLRLIPVTTASGHRGQAAAMEPDQLAKVLFQLAEEQSGQLATVRGLVEHTARQPGAADTARRLTLIAHRLHRIQQDLGATAAHLDTRPHRPRAAVPAPPTARASTRRSP
ncbi:relaxase/mobilization nuclease [Streptomyces diacarni]|uniref:relaxase/mobilization nuclease n=1 Tax=Streptomyces diacarni TaxID=2800381 RepID=UPI0033EB42C5